MATRGINKLIESYTEIEVLDEKGMGNANHKYQIVPRLPLNGSDDFSPFTKIEFQKGPIQENGVNGCTNEDLLYIVRDRLQGFQEGSFSCRENAIALTHIEEALMWLERRTLERISRGVEGRNIK